jgi:hypothetical protein
VDEKRQAEWTWLMEDVGFTPEQILQFERNDNLWLLEKESRFEDITDKEAAKLWEEAILKLEKLYDEAFEGDLFGYNPLFCMVIDDAIVRAKEACRRAQHRLEVGEE